MGVKGWKLLTMVTPFFTQCMWVLYSLFSHVFQLLPIIIYTMKIVLQQQIYGEASSKFGRKFSLFHYLVKVTGSVCFVSFLNEYKGPLNCIHY